MIPPSVTLGRRKVDSGHPVYIVAEMSGNHGQRLDRALAIIRAARAAGADAIKIQTYRPESMTFPGKGFKIRGGTLWDGQHLFNLYRKAQTPWAWVPRLQKEARAVGLDFFSSPFDSASVDFLEKRNVPFYKIASFELVDHPLIQRVAKTGKPLILSTGLATIDEIRQAVRVFRAAGGQGLVLLKCTSAYPAPVSEINLNAIPYWEQLFRVPIGFSDHTLGAVVASAAVALGACVVEKHLMLSKSHGGPDQAFSATPREFKVMVEAIRAVEQARGQAEFRLGAEEMRHRIFRRSLFVVKDVLKGDPFTASNIQTLRPALGLAPHFWGAVLRQRAPRFIQAGTPLTWHMAFGRSSKARNDSHD